MPTLPRWATTPTSVPRPLKRVLQREVADPIALELLKGSYADGDTIVVDAAPDGHLVFETAATADIVT